MNVNPLKSAMALLGLIGLTGLCTPTVAATPATPVSANDYARPPVMSGLVPSPSGKRLAMLLVDQRDGKRGLAVMDLPPTAPPRVVATYGDANITSVRWVNENRLVYDAVEGRAEVRQGYGGVFAVDHDGQNPTTLIALASGGSVATGSRAQGVRTLDYRWGVVGKTAGDGENEVLVAERQSTATGESFLQRHARLDTLTGRLTPILVGAPARSHSWVFDAQGEPRVVATTGGGRVKLHLRTPGTETWTVFSDLPTNDAASLEPLYLEGEDQLIVKSRAGRDTEGLYVFNLRTRQLETDPLVSVARYDVQGASIDPAARRVVAAHVMADRPQAVWFSPRLAALQKLIDASLPPGRTNHILCNRCETSAFYVVHSSSDQFPGEYLLYDPAQRRLSPLGATHPWINPAQQGQRSFHWVTARDGLPMPVVVTHPAGSTRQQALPTVVLVHGGPWTHGTGTAWNPEAQFFAARGYRVVEPAFRGTLGYGYKHFQASWKQWGQTMQDDVTDAAQWAVKEGLSDGKRLCIYGGSYGGYSALMGPIRDPGLYRCAVSVVGVTDIMLMFTSNQSDLSDDWKHYGMPQMVGDPVADRAMLDRHSPVLRAAEIKVPVLLAQGLLDRRVPEKHADAFEAAARAGGVAIERVNYGDEGHGFVQAKNRSDFWNRVADFLDKHLKP